MEIHPLKIILVFTNFSTFFFLISLMVDHFKAQNDLTSFASVFNMISFIWLGLRGIFWLLTITSTSEWAAWTFYLLYWMPTPLEFGALMLLPFYYAKVIYSEEWKGSWGIWIKFWYSWTMIGLILFQALWAIVEAVQKSQVGDMYQTEFKSEMFRCVTAACFFILTVVQSLYGIQLLYLDKRRYDHFFTTRREILAVVNVILVLSFFSRSIYQILALFKLYSLPRIRLQGTADAPLMIFIFSIFWNYLPTVLLIVTITSRTIGSDYRLLMSSAKNQHSHEILRYIDTEDSDEDSNEIYDSSPKTLVSFTADDPKTSTGRPKLKGSVVVEMPNELESIHPSASSFKNVDHWLCDSDPQSYCLTTHFTNHFNNEELAMLLHSKTETRSTRSRYGSAGDAVNSYSSGAGTSAHTSECEQPTTTSSIIGRVGNGSGQDPTASTSTSNTSFLNERCRLFALYHLQHKKRAGSMGSYGSLTNFELSRLNLAVKNSVNEMDSFLPVARGGHPYSFVKSKATVPAAFPDVNMNSASSSTVAAKVVTDLANGTANAIHTPRSQSQDKEKAKGSPQSQGATHASFSRGGALTPMGSSMKLSTATTTSSSASSSSVECSQGKEVTTEYSQRQNWTSLNSNNNSNNNAHAAMRYGRSHVDELISEASKEYELQVEPVPSDHSHSIKVEPASAAVSHPRQVSSDSPQLTQYPQPPHPSSSSSSSSSSSTAAAVQISQPRPTRPTLFLPFNLNNAAAPVNADSNFVDSSQNSPVNAARPSPVIYPQCTPPSDPFITTGNKSTLTSQLNPTPAVPRERPQQQSLPISQCPPPPLQRSMNPPLGAHSQDTDGQPEGAGMKQPPRKLERRSTTGTQDVKKERRRIDRRDSEAYF